MSDKPKYYRLKKSESICYSCRYSKQLKSNGLHCQLNNEKPNILFVCSNFKLFSVRDDKIHKDSTKNQTAIFIGFLFVVILLFLTVLTNITIALTMMILGVFFYGAYYASKPNPIIISHGWFIFLYLVFSLISYINIKKTSLSLCFFFIIFKLISILSLLLIYIASFL